MGSGWGGSVGGSVGTVFQYGDSTTALGVFCFWAIRASMFRPMSVTAALVEISVERLHTDVPLGKSAAQR